MKFLEELAGRQRFGIRPGLETITAIAQALGNPQHDFKAIHVAGTNGKGAVCVILDAYLRELGFKTGRYTSPHLVRLNERFLVNGVPVADDRLDTLAQFVNSQFENSKIRKLNPTFFEALTAVAFKLYAEEKVDYAVLECGLGGRLDATNVCCPVVSVITRIGLDHCDWLGDTVEKIAAEKAGIIKPGVPVVVGRNEPNVVSVIAARAEELKSPFYYAPDLVDESEVPLDFPLPGKFNRENAQTAFAALKVLGFHNSQFENSKIRKFPSLLHPGRYQKVGRFIIDGAHNPPAAKALVEALEADKDLGGEKVDLIFGACADKDVDEVLRILGPHINRAFAVETNNPRSFSAEELAARMNALGIPTQPAILDILENSQFANSQFENSKILICGSLFLVGEALVKLGAYPYSDIRFDPSERR